MTREALASGLRRALSLITWALPWITVLTAFFGARYYYRIHIGARFDASSLAYCIQFVDAVWLRDDLLRTLWSLHHQAPLLDLLIGVSLKLSPGRWHELLDAVFLSSALGLALGLLHALKRLGVRPWIAALATSLYTASPTVALYELWLLYHHLVTALFVLALVALQRFMRRETVGAGVAFFSALSLVVLTRATFGLVYMAAIAAAIMFYGTVSWRTVLKAAALPMLVIALYTAKTPLTIGRSLGHALVGPNLVIKIREALPPPEREVLMRSEALAPVSFGGPFPNLERYPEYRAEGVPVTGVPALDELTRPNGEINANALQYAYIADTSLRDAKLLLRRYPQWYLRSVRAALEEGYFRSAANDFNITKAFVYPPFKELDEEFTGYFDPQPDESLRVLTVSLALALIYGILRLLSPRSWVRSQRATATALAMMIATILYAASSLLISYGDFARYRFEVDVYYVVLLAMLFDDGASAVTPRRAWIRRLLRR